MIDADGFLDELEKNPKKLKKFLFDILGPEKCEITGKEKNHILLISKLIEPSYQISKNKIRVTEVYKIGNYAYLIHYFPNDVIVEKFV